GAASAPPHRERVRHAAQHHHPGPARSRHPPQENDRGRRDHPRLRRSRLLLQVPRPPRHERPAHPHPLTSKDPTLGFATPPPRRVGRLPSPDPYLLGEDEAAAQDLVARKVAYAVADPARAR